MAKKKATAATEQTKGYKAPGTWTEIPRFWKECPSCHGLISGYRTGICPGCKAEQPKKETEDRPTGPKKRKADSNPHDIEKSAMMLALRTGSPTDALDQLEKVKASPILSFIAEAGSVDAAIAAMKSLEASVKIS